MHPNSSINSFHLATNNGDDSNFYSGGASGSAHGGAHGGVGAAYWSEQPPAMTNCLIRQSSSPPFLHQHLTSDIGISHTKGGETWINPQAIISSNKHKQSSLSSYQLRFANHESMSTSKMTSTSSTPSSSRGFTIGPWEECNSIVFDATEYDPQSHAPSKDSVAWRIRAKRGFATHPRSIAERERRTKINCKLKKLQELLPNIDKQASYAEMLDVAVEHVKGLQSQIQELNEELNSCTCGCKLDK